MSSLQEADYGQTEAAMQGAAGRYQGDEFLLVKFYIHPRISQGKSSEAGRPIYVDTPYISIMQPGNKDSIVIRPATDMDKNRFSSHWRKFQDRINDDEIQMEGTLLEEWAGVSRAQCEELRYLHIRTVEQLANMSDSNTQGIMGINGLKTKANKFLESSKDSATSDALAALEAKYEALLAKIGGNPEPDDMVPDLSGDIPDAPVKRTRRTKAEMEEARGNA